MKKSRKLDLNTVFAVSGEMVKDNGEDSHFYAARGSKTIIAAFDGCGGIGARRYANYSGKTGAYVASRAVCGGVKGYFDANNKNANIKSFIDRALKICEKHADDAGRLMGSMGKAFPTTAAVIEAEKKNEGIECRCFWAGDSRCYMLDADGLYQLSEDDVDGEDAMSNIIDDGVLTNVINSSVEYEVHEKKLSIDKPCVLITATDGCFAYVKNPMEFEFVLLDSMIKAKSPDKWKETLNKAILEYTGDDYTLCVAMFGLESYQQARKYFVERRDYIYREYIEPEEANNNKWDEYKVGYSKYMEK